MRSTRLSSDDILRALDDIPSSSDISGAEDDSDFDETYYPDGTKDQSSDEDDREDDTIVGTPDPSPGPSEDIELGLNSLPDLPPVHPDGDFDLPPVHPQVKRRRISGLKKKTREWSTDDLEPREMPESTMKPKGLEDCKLDVQYFMKMFGEENIRMITYESNILIAKESIERNKNIPPFSEAEIRITLGILMYMSVVSMPSIKLYWQKSMRIEAVASVMTRDRFNLILSKLHLSNNDIQPGRNSPQYDRLYKVRSYLSNLSSNFAEYADTEEVLSVDEQMIPFKGQLGLKVYMRNKPKKWGIKVRIPAP